MVSICIGVIILSFFLEVPTFEVIAEDFVTLHDCFGFVSKSFYALLCSYSYVPADLLGHTIL